MHLWYALLPGVIALALAGCGSSTETREAETQAPAPGAQTPPRIQFETRTDTVALEKSQIDSMRLAPAGDRQVEVRYMVQIGAFKDAHYASLVQSAARERYHMPTINDYNTESALYQIRLGFFETREAATAFRQRLQKDYPRDYKDAWIVQLKK